MFGNGLISHIYAYSSDRHPDVNFGLISALEDQTIRFFLSFGYDDCAGAPNNSIPASEFRQSVLSLRDNYLIPDTRWSTYYVDNSTHVQLSKRFPVLRAGS